jgi:Notch-like protein
VDIDECAASPCAHGTCTNGKNQYTCNCASTGYKGSNCEVDIDECASPPCDPLTTCTNSAGGFSCSNCPAGYAGSGLSGCNDINECAVNNGGCGVDTCTNTPLCSVTCTP